MHYNITENDFKNYVFGKGWPVYRNISISQMAEDMYRRENAENDTAQSDTLTAVENSLEHSDNTTVDIITDMPQGNVPRYDSAAGSSVSPTGAHKNCCHMPTSDIALMKTLYTALNAILISFVEAVLDTYEYVGSPIYEEDGVDRESVAQIISKVTEMAEKEMDDMQEISLEGQEMNMWSRQNMLHAIIEALVLNEIFAVRRPKYRRVRGNYVYENGSYAGVREQ